MSMLLAAFMAMGPAADVTPNAVNWGTISGATSGTNADQTLSGTALSITVSISKSPAIDVGIIEYSLAGGAFTTYTTPFVVNSVAGQTLRFQVSTGPGIPASATVTVTNDTDGGTTLDTFTYSLTG